MHSVIRSFLKKISSTKPDDSGFEFVKMLIVSQERPTWEFSSIETLYYKEGISLVIRPKPISTFL